MDTELLKRITIDPGIFNRKPIVRGLRFKVADVFRIPCSGYDNRRTSCKFSFLEADDIKSSLIYAAEKIDHSIIKISLNAA